ncbi:MAG TPA: 1-(5-phosphoribosyl)-5-[(5-phosphoribosylamino)methylideneamino] imidazole-4-carboxamide isomerase [Terriglobales bacterium]|nr:1-(5-phosphoribosyl)-5-[(5-phosphoribosylamino)methylideneamino] imidazole-4-carboxamide isomerase [Terriglobales bacterium]
MLIPSVDLMGGRIVQLVQGERKALEFENFDEWVSRFIRFPLVQLIDLDAAKRIGNNRTLIRDLAKKLPCQVGGGLRTVRDAEDMLDAGARRVIFGSSLIREGVPDTHFAAEIAESVGSDRLVFAIDSKEGRVAIRGWREITAITAIEMIGALESRCEAFLYTNIDTEGSMSGIPFEAVRRLRQATSRQLIVAGGIATLEEVQQLDAMQVDAVVGMAIYAKNIDLGS